MQTNSQKSRKYTSIANSVWHGLNEQRIKFCKDHNISLDNPPKSVLQAWAETNNYLLVATPTMNDSYWHGLIQKEQHQPSKKAQIKALVMEYLLEVGYTRAEIKGNYISLRNKLQYDDSGWPVPPTTDRWGNSI